LPINQPKQFDLWVFFVQKSTDYDLWTHKIAEKVQFIGIQTAQNE